MKLKQFILLIPKLAINSIHIAIEVLPIFASNGILFMPLRPGHFVCYTHNSVAC